MLPRTFPFAASLLGVGLVVLVPSSARSQLIATQEAELSPADASAGGVAHGVAISGDTLVVGNPADSPGGIAHAGSVAVFVRNGDTWTQQAKLTASDSIANDSFGHAVALSGETLVVGAGAYRLHNGAVYVFVRDGESWTQQAKLDSLDGEAGDEFGYSVGISGDTIVVGAPRYPGATWGGAAYVFVREGTSWSQQAQLLPSGLGSDVFFGQSVAISGDTVVCGSPFYITTAFNAGAVYVFVRNGTTWSEQAKFTGVADDEELGWSVAMEGDTVIAGGLQEEGPFTEQGPGLVRVFVRSGVTWSQQATLKASGASPESQLGWCVALSGDTVVVSSRFDAPAGLAGAGAAYVFTRGGAAWTQQARLIASDATMGDWVAVSVAISGGTVIAGSLDNDDDPSDWGRASVFHLQGPGGPWTNLGFGLAGLGGVSNLGASGSLVAGSAGQLLLTGGKPSSPAYLIVGPGTMPAPFKGGTLVPLPALLIVPLVTNASGAIPLAWASWPAGAPPGLELDFQYVIPDAAAPKGMALSNALRAIMP